MFAQFVNLDALNKQIYNQYLNDDIFLLDLDHEIWLKCDECSSTYHKSCWEDFIEREFDAEGHFLCFKYTSQCPV